MVESFLKASYMDVKTQNLPGKGMLGGQLFCAPDALLPRGVRHGAIIGLQLEFVQPRAPEFHPTKKAVLGLTVCRLGDYSFSKLRCSLAV